MTTRIRQPTALARILASPGGLASPLLARLPDAVAARVRERLGLDLFVVAAVTVVVLRLFDVSPWAAAALDHHAYWATRDGFDYARSNPYLIGAYLYAPAFAQVISPLTALPWPAFSALWTALLAAVYAWLVGRWAMPLVLTVVVALEFFLGQVDILIAAAIVVGFRYPAVWAFPLLTKVAPGVGLVWYAVRREWRNLAVALAATVAVAAVSALVAPELWRGWYDLLRRSLLEPQSVSGMFVPIPMWLRLPFAVAVIAWGARTDRHWTVPIGVLLAMPILFFNVLTLLIAVIPLREEFGSTPARDWLLRERLLRPTLRTSPARAG